MIEVKVISKVEIPDIQEGVITELIKKEILKSNPDIVITDIAFERKLSPNRIIAKVDAQLGNSSVPATQTAVVEETAESPSEEETSTEEETTPESVTTVSDLFEDED